MKTESLSKFWKLALFCSLTIVTTANIVCVNFSRIVFPGDSSASLYYPSTSVFCNELAKIILSCVLLLYEVKSCSRLMSVLKTEVFEKWSSTLKMAVPAIVYVIQNNLSFFALGNLDPATYQVTYQLKLLTTALVMRLLLGKILTSKQWGALFVLLIGVCLVEIEKLAPQDMTAVSRQMLQTASANKKDDSVIGEERSYDSPAGSSVNVLAGIAATIGMTFCSAFAGVYFEKMVRSSPASSSGGKGLQQGAIKLSELGELWVKNIQLYLFSCISALAACLLHDGDKIAENGFFHGYNSLTVVVVLIGSAGGTATALMLKYLDNIYKNFASSMSLVLASFCSFCLTGQLYGPKFFLGSFLVCLSLFIYQSTQKTLTNKTTVGSNSANRQRNLPLPMYMPKEVISKVMEQNDVSKA